MAALHAALKSGAALLRARLLDKGTPLAVSWLTTTRCNAKCGYCNIPHREVNDLSTNRFLALMEEVKAAGAVRVLFTGGEPLLRPDIGELAAAARDLKLQVSLITNGFLLEKRLPALLSLHQVTVSFDGERKIMDHIRGKGSFNAALAGARAVSAAGLPLKISVVLSKLNLGQIDFLVDLAGQLGAVVYFQPTESHPLYADGINPLAPNVSDYRAAISHLIALRQTNPHIGNSVPGLYYLRRWPGPAPIKCLGGLLFARIEPDGRVTVCGRKGDRGIAPEACGGFANAFRMLKRPHCTGCWGASRVELYLTYRGRPEALANLLRLK